MKYLLLTLVLFYSCKGKEKPVTKYGSIQDSTIFVDSFNARVKRVQQSFHESDISLVNPLIIVGDSGMGSANAFTFKLDDTLGYINFNPKFCDSADEIGRFNIEQKGSLVHHKKKLTDWSKFVDRYDTIKFAPAGTTIASSPYFRITSWGITDVSDSGRIVAIRDSSGHWDIKDPARALEIMYKIVWKKDR